MSSVLILIVLYSVLIFYQSVVCCGVVLLEDLLRVVGKGRAYRSHNWLLKQWSGRAGYIMLYIHIKHKLDYLYCAFYKV